MTLDRGTAADMLSLDAAVEMAERAKVRTTFIVQKWDEYQIRWARRRLGLAKRCEPGAREFRVLRITPFDEYRLEDCNLILNAGWVLIMNGIAGTSITKFSASVGRIGGGISSTAPAYTQSDLQAATGASNRQWELVSGAPTVGSGSGGGNGLSFAATFPTTDGNFTWAEFGVDQGTAGGTGAAVATMLNRGTASPGTKTSSQTWNVTVAISWA